MWTETAKHKNQKRPLALGLILTGAVLRLLPHLPNFAPVLCQNSALLKDRGCNLMHRKVLASFYQHLMAEAPGEAHDGEPRVVYYIPDNGRMRKMPGVEIVQLPEEKRNGSTRFEGDE